MNWLTKLAILTGWFKIDTSKVNWWIDDRNLDLLKFTLKKGLYPERIQAIKGFKKLNHYPIIPELVQIGRNDFEAVAKEAISAIIDLDINSKYQFEVERLQEYWRRKKEKVTSHRTKRNLKTLDKKSRMKNLEHLRKQLKKPGNTGKWF